RDEPGTRYRAGLLADAGRASVWRRAQAAPGGGYAGGGCLERGGNLGAPSKTGLGLGESRRFVAGGRVEPGLEITALTQAFDEPLEGAATVLGAMSQRQHQRRAWLF